MTARHGTWLSQAASGVGVTSPLEARLAIAAMLVKDTAGKARPGIFYEGNLSLVQGKSSMGYDVLRFGAAQVRSALDGATVFQNDGTVTLTQNDQGGSLVAPSSNSRIDRIYTWHRDFALDGSNSDPVIAVASGEAAPDPTPPSIPTGAIEIARAEVSSGATATNGAGVVITQTAQFTATAGGKVVFRTLADLQAWTTASPRQDAAVLADPTTSANGDYVWNGSVWQPASGVLGVVSGFPAAQSGIGTTEVAINGMSITVFVPYAGNVRVSGGFLGYGTTADMALVIRVKEGSTTIAEFTEQANSSPSAQATACYHMFSRILTGVTAGSHTYSVSLVRAVGSGTLNVAPSSPAAPSQICVEMM